MSKLKVVIDYNVAVTVINGLRGQAENMKSQSKNLLNWLDELQDILDKAVIEQKPTVTEDDGAWP